MGDNITRVSTGIDGLDEILHGGYPQHTMILIRGEPGTGKTTAALQFMTKGVERGEKALFVSLSQTPAQLDVIARAHGFDLAGIEVAGMDSLHESAKRSFSIDTNESLLVDLMRCVYDAVERVDPDLLVFDSLLELRLLSPDPMAYRTELLGLRHRLAVRRVTTLLIDHVDQAKDDRQVEGVAHGVISLEAEAPPIGITHRRLKVTKLRGCAYREGYHDFRIRAGGLMVFPRIIPAASPGGGLNSQLASGQAPLDRMLGGGLEFGTTTLIAGQAGTGKSTLSALFAVAAARLGFRVGLYLFEERPEVFHERSTSVGLDVSAFEKSGDLRTFHFDPAEISPGEFSQAVVAGVETHGDRLIVIDSLSGYLNALPHRHNVVTHLHTLLQYLARRGVLVIVTMAQHGLLGEPPRSELDTSYLADSIVLLRHYAAASDIRRSIAVLKKRHSAHERKIQEFVIQPGAVKVVEISDETASRQRHTQLVGGL